MTNPDTNGQLSVEQLNAIDLLVSGESDQEVATCVGVTRQTVCEWRNHHSAFIAALNERREAIWGSQIDRLRALTTQAIDALAAGLESPDVRTRLQASVHVLKAIGLYGGSLLPAGPTTTEGVEAIWVREEEIRLLDGLAARRLV